MSKIGPMIVLALPENHSSKIKDKVLESIKLDDLKCDRGYENLITFMDKILSKDSLADVFDRYADFEKYARTDESVEVFIEEFDLKYNKLKKFNINLPSEILAFKLLIQANITSEELMLVKSGMNYEEKESLYDQAKASLRKFKSQCHIASTSGFSIKTESVNMTRGGRLSEHMCVV